MTINFNIYVNSSYIEDFVSGMIEMLKYLADDNARICIDEIVCRHGIPVSIR